eukprot:jgi/Galph1/5701/GphlegSOOS_G4352.1
MSSVLNQVEKHHFLERILLDREEAVQLVTTSYFELYRGRGSINGSSHIYYRLSVPFVPSLPGSGRTVFLKSYLYLVRNLGEGAIICNGFRDLKQTFLENLYQASLLYVDLKKLQPREPWKRDFHWAVYYAIIEAACSKAGIPMLSMEEAKRGTCNFLLFVRDILKIPKDQFLIIAFDDCEAMEERANEFDLHQP